MGRHLIIAASAAERAAAIHSMCKKQAVVASIIQDFLRDNSAYRRIDPPSD